MIDRDESGLLDSEMAQINALVDEFEQSLRAGGSPRIEDYLVRFAAGVRPLALRELLRVEIELRLARRESVSVGEYLQRFRGLETPILDAFRQSDVALATAAHDLSGPATRAHHDSDTGRGHLEVRCPNCHAPTEVAVDTSLTDLTCSSCGSHFSLVDQSQATRMAPSLTKMGRFELIERIGVGAFGSVWKARDKELDRTVAVKIPRAGGMTAEEQEKFFREARAAAQLHHPSIVSVHEVGRDGDSVYIVSDFVRGVTLGDWLTGQQLTSREAAELCAKLADALHHAHEQGVVHRDLKPANIMMDYEGQPHLMDFGLARREAGEVTMTMDGQVLGTPAYMSPEQAEGEAHTADRRSDVYSLGVILFQLLTGELPFRGNARMLIKQVVHDEPPSPRKLNANISKDLETITLKCLEKDPQRRYQTARELGDELNRFLAGEPILARPIGRAQRAWRWCRRRPAIAGLAAAVAALLLFVAIAGPLIALRQSILRVKAEEDEARATRLAADEAAARKDAEHARQLEREQRKKVEELVEANRQQLVRMNVLQGDALVERNDPARALPWYFDALRLDQGDAKREAPHRLRLATLWQNLPKFCHVWRHDAAVVGVAISRDERFIATASEDRTARVWNLATGEPATPPLAHDATVLSTAFSPDATKLITAGGVLGVNGEIRVWDVATGKPLGEPIRSPTTTYVYAAFTDAGDILSVEVPMSGHGLVRLRKPDTHEIVATKTCQPYSPGYEAITQLADVPRGRILERDGNSLRVVDLTGGGRTLCELSHSTNPIRSPRFSNDGTRLFTAEWNKLHVWDVETGRELANFEGFPSGWDGEYLLTLSARFTLDNSRVTIAGNGSQVMQLVVDSGKIDGLESVPDVRHARPIISGDGRFVAHVMRDGTVRIWDVRSEQVVASPLNHSSSVTDALFATNGQQIVTACGDGSVRAWDLATASGVVWQISDNNLARVDLSADGKEIITFGPMSVRRWRIDTHELIAEFVVPGSSPNVAMAPHGMPLYAVGRNDGTAQVWNYVTGEPVSPELQHEKKELNFVRISPDGTRLATIDVDSRVGPKRYLGQANVWDIESGRRIFGPFRFSGIISGTIGMAFSPDSRLVAVAGATVTLSGVQPQLTVIDLGTSQAMKQQFTHSPGNGVFEVAFDPRGRYLVSRTQNTVAIGSGEMRVWDLKEGREVGVARRFGDDPTSLEIDPESRFVAASVANQVYIYHLETGEPAGAPLMHDAFVSRVAFSPGGEYLISSSQDNMIRVWDVATGRRMGPTFPHPAPVYEFEITADGGLLTACGDGWARYWGFRPFDRPQNDILRMARLLSAEEISASQLARASAAEGLRGDWDALRHSYPAEFRSSEMQRQVWHERQATNCSNQQDWLGGIGHFEQLAKLKNVNHLNFGVVLCEAGQFDRGADQFDQAIQLQPDVFRNWYVAAAARLGGGDIARYRETCRKMLERFAKTDDPQAASDTAKTCLLGPNEFQTDSLPFELAERAMLHEAGHPLSGWIRLSKAIADYRAGDFDRARALLEKLNDEPVVAERTTTVKFLLAMVQWRQEMRDEARASLADAVDYAANNPIEGYAGSWLGRTLVGVVQREAEELIADNQLPTSTHRPVPTRQ